MKNALKFACGFLVVILAIGAWVFFEARHFLDTPPSSNSEEVVFDVQPGTGLGQIARSLADNGLITDARKFVWLAQFRNESAKVQAGRFILNKNWKPEEVLNALVNGKGMLYRITIPEGLTWWQTARLLEDAGFVRFGDFAEVVRDPEFLRHYGIPFSSAEGFLMPDTYLLKKLDDTTDTNPDKRQVEDIWRAQARSVAGRMVDNFWRKTAGVWPGGEEVDNTKPVTNNKKPGQSDLRKWVTLASIVEKETAIDSERKRVGGVYTNRLAKNMLLQADPTVIYGLGPEFKGQLLRANLEDSGNPYNTYQKPGLPPGPICSFGVAALNGAVYPEKHDYLYFVAITDGGEHAFSRTLDEHNIAVREYRKQKRAKP